MPGRYLNGDKTPNGYNGQRRTDEVYGTGNLNTAMFWEYDTRLGRRWNVDPKPYVGQSVYSTFNGNPVANNDINGDQSPFGYMGLPRGFWESAGIREPYNQEEALNWALWLPKEYAKDLGALVVATLPVEDFIAAGGGAILEKLAAKEGSEIFKFGAYELDIFKTTQSGRDVIQVEIKVVKAEDNVATVGEIATPKSKVVKSKKVEPIGNGRFTKHTEVRPSKVQPGQSRAEYVRIKNKEGKTIRSYKDSYDRANRFQHRKPTTGNPEGTRPAKTD